MAQHDALEQLSFLAERQKRVIFRYCVLRLGTRETTTNERKKASPLWGKKIVKKREKRKTAQSSSPNFHRRKASQKNNEKQIQSLRSSTRHCHKLHNVSNLLHIHLNKRRWHETKANMRHREKRAKTSISRTNLNRNRNCAIGTKLRRAAFSRWEAAPRPNQPSEHGGAE